MASREDASGAERDAGTPKLLASLLYGSGLQQRLPLPCKYFVVACVLSKGVSSVASEAWIWVTFHSVNQVAHDLIP